jgi:signal transduction histidine kinase
MTRECLSRYRVLVLPNAAALSADQAAAIIDNARVFKELEDSYEKLKDLDRTKMEFFTLISHELRNPLAVIKGFSELLYDGTLGPVTDKQREKLQRIRENVDRLTDIVGKMSDISSFESRRYAVDKALFALSDMVGELADTIRFLFTNKRITLEVNIPPGLPLVEADRKKIEQVLLNLLNNALKYTPDGGKVTITLKDRNSDVLVSVHDTGIGIPKKDLDKIFSGFYHSGYKLSYEYKGPGLGLAISRKFVEGHGGSIWARSEVGKGSTFYFTIPKKGIKKAAKAAHL